MKQFFSSLLLMIIALVLFYPLATIGAIYGVGASFFRVRFKSGFQKIGHYFLTIAVSIDQMGNVFCCELFNDVLIKGGGHKFGNEDETISSVLGKNKLKGTLSSPGCALDWLLNLFENDHSVKSIEEDE